ncbi:MAG: LPS assembly lipoprotein LptE [Sphingobium sp.]
MRHPIAPRTLPWAALLLAVTPLLAGCGLRPLYGGGSSGAVARNLGSVEIAPIEGKSGWLVRNALHDRLEAISGGNGPHYRLVVKLDDQITGIGVRPDDAVTRERRTLRARYQLFDGATGAVVIDATTGSDVGIDVASSEYATIAAEDTALERLSQVIADQIIIRMAQRVSADPAATPGAP